MQEVCTGFYNRGWAVCKSSFRVWGTQSMRVREWALGRHLLLTLWTPHVMKRDIARRRSGRKAESWFWALNTSYKGLLIEYKIPGQYWSPCSLYLPLGPFVILAGRFPSPGLHFLACKVRGVERCIPECSPEGHVCSKSQWFQIADVTLMTFMLCGLNWLVRENSFFFYWENE